MVCVPNAPSPLLNTCAVAPSPQLVPLSNWDCLRTHMCPSQVPPGIALRPHRNRPGKQRQINASWQHRSDLGDPNGPAGGPPPAVRAPASLPRCCPLTGEDQTGQAGAAGAPEPPTADLPLHRVRASSWCSRGWPSLPDPPLDHFRALDTKATRSGEFGSIRLNSLARFSENSTNRPIQGAHHSLGSPHGAS